MILRKTGQENGISNSWDSDYAAVGAYPARSLVSCSPVSQGFNMCDCMFGRSNFYSHLALSNQETKQFTGSYSVESRKRKIPNL